MSHFKLKCKTLLTPLCANLNHALDEIDNLNIPSHKKSAVSSLPQHLRVATMKVDLPTSTGLSAYLTWLNDIFACAHAEGATLLVFPQLFSLTLLPLAWAGRGELKRITDLKSPHLAEDFHAYMQTLGNWLYGMYVNIFRRFAMSYQMDVAAGSIFVMENNRYYNRSYVFDKTGQVAGVQDKLSLTAYEKKLEITPGESIQAIPTGNHKIAIFNDDDICFFENAKIAAHQGAELLISSYQSQDPAQIARYEEALCWRVEERSLYGVQSCYQKTYSRATCGFFAPATLSEEYSGKLHTSPKTGVLTFSLDMARVHRHFDPYASDQNPMLHQKYAPQVYGYSEDRLE